MKRILIKVTRFLGNLIGKKTAGKIILILYKATDAPLYKLALQNYGITKHENMFWSGEIGVIQNLCKEILHQSDSLIDIGANIGEYTLTLEKYFPYNFILSVEPTKETFEILKSKVTGKCINTAISEINGEISFFTSTEVHASTQASISIESIPEGQTPKEIKVNSITLERLIEDQKITSIGLLKIDTEGHDLEVLKSGANHLKKIKFIQFEFNEKYVYTRTFLKDFYDLLGNSHHFYRVDTSYMWDINNYNPYLEIFRYQNILCVRHDLVEKLPLDYIKKV